MSIKNIIMKFFGCVLLSEEEREMLKNIPSPEKRKETIRKRAISLDSLIIKMGVGGKHLDMCFEPHLFVGARKNVLENPENYSKEIHELALSYTEEQIEIETKTYYKRKSSIGGFSGRDRGERSSSRSDNFDFNNPSNPSNFSNYE